MKAVRGSQMPFFSVLGVPLLGLAALVLSLWNPHILHFSVRPDDGGRSAILLLDPDPRLDKILSIYLRQQAKQVVRYRRLAQPGDLAQAVAGYNLIARECTPAVFQATGLPPSQEM